jgi:hypothetical protein
VLFVNTVISIAKMEENIQYRARSDELRRSLAIEERISQRRRRGFEQEAREETEEGNEK